MTTTTTPITIAAVALSRAGGRRLVDGTRSPLLRLAATSTLRAPEASDNSWSRHHFSGPWRSPASSTLSLRFLSSSTTTATAAALSSPLLQHLDADRIAELQSQHVLDADGLTVFSTLHEMQIHSCLAFAPKPLFGTFSPETEKYEWMNFAEFDTQVQTCRTVLSDLGITEHSKIGIISNNRWEWATVAAAAYSLNAHIVPMYEAQLPSDWTYITNDATCQVLVCATPDIFHKVQSEVLPNTPSVQATLCLDAPADQPYSFAAVMAAAAKRDLTQTRIVAPTADDLANLIYTSGTTGKPKGVELTHMNLTSNVKAASRSMEKINDFIYPSDCSLAFLPWAHSYGQTCELWVSISHGVAMGIGRGVPRILEDLQLVKPTVLYAVPTLYKKIYDGVHTLMANAPPLRRRLMKSALEVGYQKNLALHGQRAPLGFFERFQYNLLNKLVLSKIRDRFGGQLRHGFVAGAACPVEVFQFMDSIGIPVLEGYGLTETSPIITINTPSQRHVGSVGRAIGGVKLYVVDEHGEALGPGEEGEVCCTGPNVMRGYYQNPEETAKVISPAPDGSSDHMFHTGDLGRVDEHGWLRITGRLKEQYKLENGKYVVPTPIEEAIGLSRFISQVVLAGANRPYNVALLVPEWSAIRTALKIGDNVSEDELANDPRVRAMIDEEISRNCSHLKKFEVPQVWAIVAPFTAANNMLTPKMSIRRHKVIQTYASIINHMYGDEPATTPQADPTGAKEPADEDNHIHPQPDEKQKQSAA